VFSDALSNSSVLVDTTVSRRADRHLDSRDRDLGNLGNRPGNSGYFDRFLFAHRRFGDRHAVDPVDYSDFATVPLPWGVKIWYIRDRSGMDDLQRNLRVYRVFCLVHVGETDGGTTSASRGAADRGGFVKGRWIRTVVCVNES